MNQIYTLLYDYDNICNYYVQSSTDLDILIDKFLNYIREEFKSDEHWLNTEYRLIEKYIPSQIKTEIEFSIKDYGEFSKFVYYLSSRPDRLVLSCNRVLS